MVRVIRHGLGRAAALGGAVSLTTLSGCVVIPTVKETRSIEADYVDGMSLDVVTRNGRVDVKQADVDVVVITAHLKSRSQERLDATRIVAEPDETGALAIRVHWPDDRRLGNEGCSFEIETPGAYGVRLRSSNGALSMTGLTGDAVLDTSNGGITVRGHDGPIRADTSNGGVRMFGVAGPIQIDTSNGGVTVALAPTAHGPVHIDTTNGGVRLTMPASFEGDLVLDTSNGSISYETPPNVQRVSASRHHAVLQSGAGGPTSVVSTSNGSIVVDFVPSE